MGVHVLRRIGLGFPIMAQLFRSTARAAAVCQKIATPSANAAVNSFSHKKISTTNVSYLDTSDSVVDQRMEAGDNRWWKRAYFQMQGYYEYGLYHDDIELIRKERAEMAAWKAKVEG